jgi:hypothetical protein
MTKKRHSVCLSAACGLFLLGFFWSLLPAQQVDPTAWLYQTKIINASGFESPSSSFDWVITGKKSSVVFKADEHVSSGSFSIMSYKLNSSGRPVGSAVPVLVEAKENFPYASALWIDGPAAGSSPAENEYGLISVGFTTDAEQTTAAFAVAKFDADGRRTSPYTILKEVTAPTGQTIMVNLITASKGEGRVGIAFCAFFLELSASFAGYPGSKAWFAEIELDGQATTPPELTSNVREIPLPNNGNLKQALPYAPAWNGSRWLIPLRLSNWRTVPASGGGVQTVLAGEDAMVAIALDGNKKLRLRRLFGHSIEKDIWSYRLTFLERESDGGTPARPAGKAGDNLDLFYIYRQFNDTAGNPLDRYWYSYGIRTASGKGKLVGPGIVIEIPKWEHKDKPEGAMILGVTGEYCSNPLDIGDGEMMVSTARSVIYSPTYSPPVFATLKFENELCLYSFDRETGKVELKAVGNPQMKCLFKTPYIHWFRGKMSVLNQADFFNDVGQYTFSKEFFTRF